jgi:hypothetical protein
LGFELHDGAMVRKRPVGPAHLDDERLQQLRVDCVCHTRADNNVHARVGGRGGGWLAARG